MDRGAWWATVSGVTRVGCNLETKPPPPHPEELWLLNYPSGNGELVEEF